MAPTTTKQWTVDISTNYEGLTLSEAPIPKVGDNDVLVKIHAASLNYRDLMVSNGTYHPWGAAYPVVPGCDAAGEVISVGSSVARFKTSDRVLPTFSQSWIGGTVNMSDIETCLGASIDGTLRQYAVFNEQGLAPIPSNLSYIEAATLPCAAVTAWSALYGGTKPLRMGDTVVVQRTGGVSIFAALFAVKAGARVITTTSSPEKEKKLRELGVHDVINYKTDPSWGETVRKLTNGRGAQYIIEVGGPGTLVQSGKAAALDGEIEIIGSVGGIQEGRGADPYNFMCLLRRILVGSRIDFEEINRAIENVGIKPVVDEKIWGFEELKEAYTHLQGQKHFGKVVVRVE